MNSFKTAFGEIAKVHGFEKAFGGWFKTSPDCIIVLDLQKSNFGACYYLNIKIYIQGAFGNVYAKSKDLVKKDIGDVFTRPPSEYEDVFELDNSMDEDIRKQRLEELFRDYIVPFTNKAISRTGLKELAVQEEVLVLPAVKQQLGL